MLAERERGCSYVQTSFLYQYNGIKKILSLVVRDNASAATAEYLSVDKTPCYHAL